MYSWKNVELFCYALGANNVTEWRRSIQSEAEDFVDMSIVSPDAIEKMSNDNKMPILIGYTKCALNDIFSMLASIQVSYMGSIGTTDDTYIDYLVTDEFVSPLQHADIYSKKIVQLPHCYIVNDYKQKNQQKQRQERDGSQEACCLSRGKVKAFSKDDSSKASRLTKFLGCMAGITHIVIEVKKPRSKLHKKDTCEPITIVKTPPTLIVVVMGYVKTSCGLRMLTVWAQHLSEEVKQRFCKNCMSKKKAFTKYSKQYESKGGRKILRLNWRKLRSKPLSKRPRSKPLRSIDNAVDAQELDERLEREFFIAGEAMSRGFVGLSSFTSKSQFYNLREVAKRITKQLERQVHQVVAKLGAYVRGSINTLGFTSV
ncbi:hypothetical protein Fmac_028978 [Flemingia macrophylla]|uniref:Uncharacterized protein n=1 Tax=Flemingia macrophylla TaxID=520843 RepID=A0ABD1L928_9FABA